MPLPTAAGGSAQVVLTDLSGRSVLTYLLRGATKATVPLPISLKTGIYLLQVQNAGFVSKLQRLVIQWNVLALCVELNGYSLRQPMPVPCATCLPLKRT